MKYCFDHIPDHFKTIQIVTIYRERVFKNIYKIKSLYPKCESNRLKKINYDDLFTYDIRVSKCQSFSQYTK